MLFLHTNQTGTHPAGKNSLLFFWYHKHTAGDLRKAKRQHGARPPKAGRAHSKKGGFAALNDFISNIHIQQVFSVKIARKCFDFSNRLQEKRKARRYKSSCQVFRYNNTVAILRNL